PSRTALYAASNAASVTLLASCISASSCALLIWRHPAVTGVALASRTDGAALPTPSAKTYFVVSSMPSTPLLTPRSRKPCATRSYGLWSSCQVRTSGCASSGLSAICSRARSSSNAGHTKNAAPFAGTTAANSRSAPDQRMPVKYCMDVPLVSMMASSLFSSISRRARSSRSRRSSLLMGWAWSRMDFNSAIDGGNAPGACGSAANDRSRSDPAAPAAVTATKLRLEIIASLLFLIDPVKLTFLPHTTARAYRRIDRGMCTVNCDLSNPTNGVKRHAGRPPRYGQHHLRSHRTPRRPHAGRRARHHRALALGTGHHRRGIADAGRRQHHPAHRALREVPLESLRADAAARGRAGRQRHCGRALRRD